MSKIYQSAAQGWLQSIPIMQQTVLFSAIRGMDGMRKLHPAKMLIRFYRRCVLVDAMTGETLANPYAPGGGDFTGPSLEVHPAEDATYEDGIHYDHLVYIKKNKFAHARLDDWPEAMQYILDNFLRARDEMPLHYFSHTMHAFQILGYRHPDPVIRDFWLGAYTRMAHALHLWPETVEQMDRRLGDDEAGWREREDPAGSCST